MKINHIAIWTNQLEVMKNFYIKYFKALPNEKYINTAKKFESYFLTFDSSARLELMHIIDLPENNHNENIQTGYAHLAFTVPSKSIMEKMYNKLKEDDFTITSPPRTTGDGYYEFAFLDPDRNIIEITL